MCVGMADPESGDRGHFPTHPKHRSFGIYDLDCPFMIVVS